MKEIKTAIINSITIKTINLPADRDKWGTRTYTMLFSTTPIIISIVNKYKIRETNVFFLFPRNFCNSMAFLLKLPDFFSSVFQKNQIRQIPNRLSPSRPAE